MDADISGFSTLAGEVAFGSLHMQCDPCTPLHEGAVPFPELRGKRDMEDGVSSPVSPDCPQGAGGDPYTVEHGEAPSPSRLADAGGDPFKDFGMMTDTEQVGQGRIGEWADASDSSDETGW